jgi:hypothetical protein
LLILQHFQSIAEPDLDEGNPFNSAWLNTEVVDDPKIVVDEDGNRLIIWQLAEVVTHIAEFNQDEFPENMSWSPEIILPTGIGDDAADEFEEDTDL